jgi:hypothetical protein
MNNKEYEKVLNQFIDILILDIHIKTYELKKNKSNPEYSDIVFNNYYKEKFIEFKKNINSAKKIYYSNK